MSQDLTIYCAGEHYAQEYFKQDIGSIRKNAEALVGVLVKFHCRRTKRLTNKFRKLEQAKPRKSNSVSRQQPSNKKQPPMAREKTVQRENVNDLATVILAKIGDTLLERLRSESKNKESAVYPVVLSDSLAIREEGIENLRNNKAAKNRKGKIGERTKTKSVSVKPLSHAKKISKPCQTHN